MYLTHDDILYLQQLTDITPKEIKDLQYTNMNYTIIDNTLNKIIHIEDIETACDYIPINTVYKSLVNTLRNNNYNTLYKNYTLIVTKVL